MDSNIDDIDDIQKDSLAIFSKGLAICIETTNYLHVFFDIKSIPVIFISGVVLGLFFTIVGYPGVIFAIIFGAFSFVLLFCINILFFTIPGVIQSKIKLKKPLKIRFLWKPWR